MIESGPAAGALMAAAYGELTGHARPGRLRHGRHHRQALPHRGRPARTTIASSSSTASASRRAAGCPMNIQAIDLVEIGAGGGSIARVATRRARASGPESAAPTPGPVCYGRGGIEPTVTDANLVLGYLNPDYFAGGAMRLDVGAAARAASTTASPRPLGLVARGGGVGHPPDGERPTWSWPRASCRSSAAAIRATSRWSPSAARGRSTAAGSRRRSASRA